MGNRATVIFTDESEKEISPAVYLHWNGGAESIYGFMNEMDRRNIRRTDLSYECARFIGIVTDFFDKDGLGSTSIGVVSYPGKSIDAKTLRKVCTDHGDNGFYIICRTNDGIKMRRFTETYGNSISECLLEEWSEEKVKKEKEIALKDDYIEGFKRIFLELQGDRKGERF